MASAEIGAAGTGAVVPSDLCVKSGVPTKDRVIITGSTTPTWVSVLLVFSVVGWLFANANSSRSYRIDVPFRHDLYDRWRMLHRLAWFLAVGGVGLAAVLGFVHVPHAADLLWITVAGVALGIGNGLLNNIGVREVDNRLLLWRLDRDAAAGITSARRQLQ